MGSVRSLKDMSTTSRPLMEKYRRLELELNKLVLEIILLLWHVVFPLGHSSACIHVIMKKVDLNNNKS